MDKINEDDTKSGSSKRQSMGDGEQEKSERKKQYSKEKDKKFGQKLKRKATDLLQTVAGHSEKSLESSSDVTSKHSTGADSEKIEMRGVVTDVKKKARVDQPRK